MTPRTLLIYKEEKDKKEREKAKMADVSAWLTGIYIGKVIASAFDSNSKYPDRNIVFTDEQEMTEEELDEVIAENTQIAAINFAAWAEAANKSRE